ncbi:hypothetical protein F9C07_2102545 [Aspergillus flavus]|uniref:Protein FAF1 n=4 Tax=Aspergillus subgen. Circumdati TaxID=2720871 RepID=A0A7U2MRT4_ASPFN|nr:hypothetical protein NYO67_12903 [Aspergillus flavus]OOO03997.1 hypothetical protein OAory_01048440 [Aspergillus oryzae]QRD88757.1 hypothetical protein F9C07_2102545 [Aspergillus flavus]RAQ56473.1 hypothetical protein COH21_002424 [Aspergillus flavus]RAQ72000.1 hypothetical protein COH20_009708 [Aspergillus flavus]
MIGKRKRDTHVVSRSTTSEEDEATTTTTNDSSSHDIFRKFFEAQFQPLEVPETHITCAQGSDDEHGTNESEESEPESEWNGVSEDGHEENKVEVVEHHDLSAVAKESMDKRARKAFMTAKPPSFSVKPAAIKSSPSKDEDDGDDVANLKNDLALQRLLKESHLLESSSDLAPTGKNRLKALDLRMQSLGAKASLYHQNMPSSHRRGIKAKAEKKDDKRRREAKENGIILEKPVPKARPSNGRRERGVGGPSIGKFAGGTLNLSKRDLSAIQGPRRSGKSKTRGRR